jgi:2-octaprenyl-6-methoxyphenol hydroxylase
VGQRLGNFVKVGQRFSYPLQLLRVRKQIGHRLALIGNAAHTLHPVAGQGFNLGLRDVAVMAQVLSDAIEQQADIGDMRCLEAYMQWRRSDHNKIIGFTHGLVKLFSNNLSPLATARNMGLVITDLCPPLKRLLAQNTMGLAGRLPRLARGITN